MSVRLIKYLMVNCLCFLLTYLVYFILIKWQKPKIQDKIEISMKMKSIAKDSIYDYYSKYGDLPGDANEILDRSIGEFSHHQFQKLFGKQVPTDYMMPIDPFAPQNERTFTYNLPIQIRSYNFSGDPIRYKRFENYFVLWSRGPNQKFEFEPKYINRSWTCESLDSWRRISVYKYDPTNGLSSGGDFVNIVCLDEWTSPTSYLTLEQQELP